MNVKTVSRAFAGIALAGLGSAFAVAQEKNTAHVPAAERAPDGAETRGGGLRRVMRAVNIAARGETAITEPGKVFQVDPKTGELIVDTPRYYLPESWHWAGISDATADSLGRPIVSRPLGWSGWTQADVDALRATIGDVAAQRAALTASSQDAREIESALGNYIGQAIVRGIVIEDAVNLLDAATVTPVVADSILERMNAFEQTKYQSSFDNGVAHQPSAYPPVVEQFVTNNGFAMADILTINPPSNGGGSRSVP